MSTVEKQEALVGLTEARSQLEALTARLLAASDDVGRAHGLRDAAAWLTVATRTTPREAGGVLALGRGLAAHPAVAAVLAAEEARADAAVNLVLVDDGEGRCHGRFVVPAHAGRMLKRHLLALANPARHTEAELRDELCEEDGGWKPLRRRLGEAFVEYLERYPEDRTPRTGGVNATVVVTMTLEQLLAENATALLDDGTRISAGQARRLACEAGIVPAVLGTASQPLDLGRRARLFSRAQRIALGL